MTDWVKDLGEQNAMLVQTVHDLEQAAVCRVKLLENKLQETSRLISQDMSHSDESEKNLNILSDRICKLQNSQCEMEQKITNLQSDIDSLLELIKQGRMENNWNLDNFQFYEIQPSDIPVPVDCTCGQDKGDAESTRNAYFNMQSEDILKLHKHQYELEDRIENLQNEINKKDKIITAKSELLNKYSFEIKELRNSLCKQINNKSNAQYQPLRTKVHANDNNLCIASVIDNGESAFDKKNLENETLREQLHNTEAKMDKLMHEYKSKIYELQSSIQDHCKENRKLNARLACLEKEHLESRDALTQEVAKEHDLIVALKQQIEQLETQLKESEQALHFKDVVIHRLRNLNLKCAKAPTTAKKVRVSFDSCQEQPEEKNIEDKFRDLSQQLEELKSLVDSKDNDISKLKAALTEKSEQSINNMDDNALHQISLENQKEIVSFLTNLKTEFEKDKETIYSLKIEYETVLKELIQMSNMYIKDIDIVNDQLIDMKRSLHEYETKILQKDPCKDNTKDILMAIKNKVSFLHKLFQNKCEMCVKENIPTILQDSISKVKSGIQTLSKIHENKNKLSSTMRTALTKKNACNNNNISEKEQEAIFSVMKKQFRMMEDFRICTVEVQAATEDLREEVSEVISNLNSRHCKYVELSNMVSQVQEYLTKTRENISEVINRLELQNEERARHSERLKNNKIRIKDIKNDFNKTQSELSKCLNNVQNNVEQSNLLGYTEIHMCNDLLISVVDEVDQIVDNLNTFQSPECCTLLTMTDLKKQIMSMEDNVKELKRKSNQVLLENEAAQKSFKEHFKSLEKYEGQVDNSHTKMQNVLESIIATTEQINQFGCLKESDDSYQSTNETIKMKDDLRKLHKECEELRLKINQESQLNNQDKSSSEWECKVIDFQNQIKDLSNEIKYKDETNNLLKQSIEILEEKLDSTRMKAEEHRISSSTKCLELKKQIFMLENSLKAQQDKKNLTCLTSNETDTKKSQILENVNNSRLFDSTSISGLQGSFENMPQFFKTLQDTIQDIKNRLIDLNKQFHMLIFENSPHECKTNDSVRTSIEALSEYVDHIAYCSGEIEKIQSAFYLQNKLLQDQSTMIKFQKDSITLSQAEVEELNKTLQEKIETQEQAISQCEREKRKLNKKIEEQSQTIGHLQVAVVEAKKTIDQLTNKATSDSVNKNKIIRSLNLYLTECQSQYTDCFGEASEQAALLELQRDAISALQKRIKFLECDELLNAFMLHFIYYVIVYKYQKELETRTKAANQMQCQIENLEATSSLFEQQCEDLRRKYDKANKDIENERNGFEGICEKILKEKQTDIDTLLRENSDLKKQLQAFKVDFNLIEEEMEKMGLPNLSVECFKEKLEDMRLQNVHFKCQLSKQEQIINDLEKEISCNNNNLKMLNSELTKSKRIIHQKECEIHNLRTGLKSTEQNAYYFATTIDKMANVLEYQRQDIARLQQNLRYQCEHVKCLQSELETLQCDYNILESERGLCESKLKMENFELLNQLKEAQERMQSEKEHIANLQKRIKSLSPQASPNSPQPLNYSESAISDQLAVAAQKNEKLEETVAKLKETIEENRNELCTKNNALTEIQAKFNQLTVKFESSERSCNRHKEGVQVMEKCLNIQKIKVQNCTEKNEELIRQNKSLEESNNKCMEELEDIVLQLEDMQSSLVELRNECDSKTKSLECVSVELEKMKVSRSEVCEESKYVLQWVRYWMREQQMIVKVLQDKLYEKQHRLSVISSEKKKFMVHMKRMKRRHRVLEKRLRLIRKPVTKQLNSLPNGYTLSQKQCQRCSSKENNGLNGYYSRTALMKESKAVLSVLKMGSRKGMNRPEYIVKMQGDAKLMPTLQCISKELPKTSQIKEIKIIKNKGKAHEEVDNGYHTSGSKSSFS